MIDSDIKEMAELRFEQIKRVEDFKHGDFDINLPNNVIARAVVHNGQIKYIEVPNIDMGFRKKIET